MKLQTLTTTFLTLLLTSTTTTTATPSPPNHNPQNPQHPSIGLFSGTNGPINHHPSFDHNHNKRSLRGNYVTRIKWFPGAMGFSKRAVVTTEEDPALDQNEDEDGSVLGVVKRSLRGNYVTRIKWFPGAMGFSKRTVEADGEGEGEMVDEDTDKDVVLPAGEGVVLPEGLPKGFSDVEE